MNVATATHQLALPTSTAHGWRGGGVRATRSPRGQHCTVRTRPAPLCEVVLRWRWRRFPQRRPRLWTLLSVLLPPPGAQVEEGGGGANERETEEGKVQVNEQRRTTKINAKVAAGGALLDDNMLDDTFSFATTHQ